MQMIALALLAWLSFATPAIQLPPATEDAALPAATVIVGGRQDIRIDGAVVALERVGDTLLALHEGDLNRRVFVKGLPSAAYGDIMEVLRAIEAVGFTNIALIAEAVP